MTKIQFFYQNRSVSKGLEVSIHWSGFASGYSKYKTNDAGEVIIEDARINDNSRKAEKVFIQNPKGGYSINLGEYTFHKGRTHLFQLDPYMG